MTTRQAKPTAFLPIEIKAREFNAKLLLALFLADSGFRVYLGSKAAVDTIVLSPRRRKGGLYLYKSGNLRNKLKPILSAVDALAVLDEEMGVAVKDLDLYYRRRITNEDAIARYFVIGDKHARKVRELKPLLSEVVRVTGWPRVDLWRPELADFYADAASAISNRFPSFILFSSDFGFNTEARIAHELRRQEIRGTSTDEQNTLETGWRKDMHEYREFLDVLEKLDGDPSVPLVVVRPHPAEDHAQWMQDTRHLKRIKVIFEGEISPWVLASQGVLHRGCTTGVQAYISGKPSLYWISEQGHRRTDGLAYKVSTHVRGVNSLKAALRDLALRSESAGAKGYKAVPPEEILIDDDLAVEKITAELVALQISPTPPVTVSKRQYLALSAKQALNAFRISMRLGLEKRRIDRHKRKFPEKITQDEVDKMCITVFPGRKFVSRRITENLFEIETP